MYCQAKSCGIQTSTDLQLHSVAMVWFWFSLAVKWVNQNCTRTTWYINCWTWTEPCSSIQIWTSLVQFSSKLVLNWTFGLNQPIATSGNLKCLEASKVSNRLVYVGFRPQSTSEPLKYCSVSFAGNIYICFSAKVQCDKCTNARMWQHSNTTTQRCNNVTAW